MRACMHACMHVQCREGGLLKACLVGVRTPREGQSIHAALIKILVCLCITCSLFIYLFNTKTGASLGFAAVAAAAYSLCCTELCCFAALESPNTKHMNRRIQLRQVNAATCDAAAALFRCICSVYTP